MSNIQYADNYTCCICNKTVVIHVDLNKCMRRWSKPMNSHLEMSIKRAAVMSVIGLVGFRTLDRLPYDYLMKIKCLVHQNVVYSCARIGKCIRIQ